MAAMATQADVETELGRVLSSDEAAKVEAALESASDYVRAETNRKWAAGTFTVRRRVRGGSVSLDAPATVTAVNAVDHLGGSSAVTDYALRGSTLYGLGCGWVEVTYTTDGTVPDELRRVVAAMAARDITEDRPQGATSYTVAKGPFTESASFDEPQDSAEPTRAEAKIIRRYALGSLGAKSLV